MASKDKSTPKPHSNGLPPRGEPAPLFFSATHWRVYDGLCDHINQADGLCAMTGAAGSGKSVLLNKVAERYSSAMPLAHLTYSNLSLRNFTDLLYSAFLHDHKRPDETPTFVALASFLEDQARRGAPVLVLLDEAHNLPDEVLSVLYIFLEFRSMSDSGSVSKGNPVVQIIISGQQKLKDRLASDRMDQTSGSILEIFELSPLSDDEVGTFLRLRLAQARPRAKLPITQEAIKRLAAYSGGLPRLVQTFCNSLILKAADEPKAPITIDMVDMAAKEMALISDRSSLDSPREEGDAVVQPLPGPPRALRPPQPHPQQIMAASRKTPLFITTAAVLGAVAGVALISYGAGGYFFPPAETLQAATPSNSGITLDQAMLADFLDKGDFYLEVDRRISPKHGNAMLMYRKALEIEPDNRRALAGLGKIKSKYVEEALGFIETDDLDEARARYKSALRIDPDDQALVQELADLKKREKAAAAQ